MRLTLDLRLAGAPAAETPDERRMPFDEIAGMIRSPRELAGVLCGRRYDELRVLRDDWLPLSGVQSVVLVLAGLMRVRRVRVGDEPVGRLAFFMRAMGAALVAVPRELVVTWALNRRALRQARQEYGLPLRPARDPDVVAYLRPEPSLQWLGASVGGAATHTSGVINGLADNGLDVRVLAPERPEGVGEEIELVRVPPRSLNHLVFWLTRTAQSPDYVRAGVTTGADFVYQRYTAGSYAGLELARRLGAPLVLEFNGSEVWIEEKWGSGSVRLRDSLAALEDRNLHDASLIVVVSDVLRDSLAEHGFDPAKVLVNPNGVDVERLRSYRESAPANGAVPTVGFVGTFGPWHGVTTLPATIEAVAAERPDARWVLIGDGPLHAQVRDEIERRGMSERVTMTGFTERERTLQLLAASDVCVSPHVPNPDGSRFFGSPTKLFEYMGLAKPIAASDLDQIGEVLEHERTALLHPPGDTDAAAAAVVRLLGDAALRERLGAAALELAEERYSWKAHVRRILDRLAAG